MFSVRTSIRMAIKRALRIRSEDRPKGEMSDHGRSWSEFTNVDKQQPCLVLPILEVKEAC